MNRLRNNGGFDKGMATFPTAGENNDHRMFLVAAALHLMWKS